MIQLKTKLKVADNTGAHEITCVLIYRGGKHKFGHIGDIINAVVTKADAIGMVKDGELVKAVIVRTHKEKRRSDGSYIRYDDNAAVLIDTPKDKNPRGTRIFGPISRELKELGFNKIISMAEEVY
jgi:large subunit ribosomal protein L14